jgi:hypothetical protein
MGVKKRCILPRFEKNTITSENAYLGLFSFKLPFVLIACLKYTVH